MSADNYYRICRHPKGGFAAVMGFMSNKLDGHEAEPRDTDPQYATVAEAVAVANRETFLEYGIQIDPDLTTGPGEPTAAILKLAFQEAMKWCENRPYFSDEGVIIGPFPDEFWGHMVTALADLRAAAGV